jgi:hypothetical protein
MQEEDEGEQESCRGRGGKNDLLGCTDVPSRMVRWYGTLQDRTVDTVRYSHGHDILSYPSCTVHGWEHARLSSSVSVDRLER